MNKMLMAGGIAVAAVAFVAKFTYEKFFNPQQHLPKSLVVQKLIDMREHLYPILFEIADLVSTKLIPKGIPPDQAKIFVMENESLAFKSNIETILKQKVYFDIEESDLQYAIENTFKDDKEVQFYRKAFQEEYEKCFLGMKPQNLTTKMLIITKQQLLKIVATLLETKILKLKEIVLDCQEEVSKLGEQTSEERKREVFAEKLSSELSKDEGEDDRLRNQVLQEYRITDVKTFEFSVAKFLQQSPDFKQKYQQLQDSFKKNTNDIIALASQSSK